MLSRSARKLGFTLLEVMIAVVILAVGLSSLFTSEAGAVRIAQRARTTTIATLLARCKMAEIEERVAKEGWPAELIEDRDDCCTDGEHDGYTCEWKVERIKLPDVEDEEKEGDDDDEESEGGDDKKESGGGGGVLDQLADLSKQDPQERMEAVTGLLSGDSENSLRPEKGEKGEDDEDEEESGSELDPISSMVMEMAFPVMKPIIEEGVRRASVNVKWKEGGREMNLEVVQFMVTEQQIVMPEDDEGDGGTPPATPGTTPGAGAGSGFSSPGAPSTGTAPAAPSGAGGR